MLNIFAYIDKIVQIAKPRQLLYMAIDGVAPRAKMNQQRSRRFRSAKDAQEALEELETKVDSSQVFDSNCITPGTQFMARLDEHLRSFIRKKLKTDEVWKRFRVIYSGHGSPGEGEHKIMEYIRAQKSRKDPKHWSPNQRHCVYGLDADLIMLGLVSHEPHFCLLREEIDFTSFRKNKNTTKTVQKQTKRVKWQLLSLGVLREYLHVEFSSLKDTTEFYNVESVIDDFVLICMLCGNDFIPHLPTLDIGEDAISLLMNTYKSLLPKMGGYICKEGVIHWGRFEMVRVCVLYSISLSTFSINLHIHHKITESKQTHIHQILRAIGSVEDDVFAERDRARRSFLSRKRKPRDDHDRRKAARIEADADKQVRLAEKLGPHNDTFKNRYYLEKFGITPPAKGKNEEESEVKNALCREYLRGLSWVLKYYYGGVASWGWYYPFHYAPLASDLLPTKNPKNLDKFEIGKPFLPFEQLLGCLPPASANFLPRPYRDLMTLESSPIADLYPLNFEVDMNGAHNPWEGVNLLPFIDEKRLRDAMKGLLEKCTCVVFSLSMFCEAQKYRSLSLSPLHACTHPYPCIHASTHTRTLNRYRERTSTKSSLLTDFMCS